MARQPSELIGRRELLQHRAAEHVVAVRVDEFDVLHSRPFDKA